MGELIQFTLTMPSNNAWNGRWSGEDNFYAVVRRYRAKSIREKILSDPYRTYSFGDGWVAAVRAEETDAAKARKTRKQSRGFCGYEWMIDSIERVGKIDADAA